MASGMAVLVVGASGFLGQHVAASLIAAGHRVTGLGPFRPEQDFDRFVVGRSEYAEPLADALSGVDAVIYLGGASRPAIGMARVSDEIMREANHVIDLAEVAARHRVTRFVFASSGGTVYGATGKASNDESVVPRPASNYGFSKLVSEYGLQLIAGRTALKAISLRISNPYGPGQRVKGSQGFVAAVCEAIVNGRPVSIWGDGSTVRDFIYVRDVAEAFVRALSDDCAPGTYNIGVGTGLSLLDLCRGVERRAGHPLEIKFQPGRAVDLPHNVLDIRKAETQMGWTPSVSLEEGLDRTLRWWRSH